MPYNFFPNQNNLNKRIDLIISEYLSLPRHQIQRAIEESLVKIGEEIVKKPSQKLKVLKEISIKLSAQEQLDLTPEKMQLDILFEDEALLVLNKAAHLVVHPGAGHSKGTLVNGILAHCGSLPAGTEENKPGIVHRLDKGTSGLMVIAKTDGAMNFLLSEFKERKVEKKYLALVLGNIPDEGEVDRPIGRHVRDRQRFSSRTNQPKEALTEWKIRQRYEGLSLIEVTIHTGRTHQIRVHLTEEGYPLIGDPTYGRQKKRLEGVKNKKLREALKNFSRPALHAWKLGFDHPVSGQWMAFEAPLPEDFERLLSSLLESL